MMIGLDTGFFFELLTGNPQAIELFEQTDADVDLCASCLTLFELKELALRGALDKEAVDVLIENIMSLCHISWLDTVEVHNLAASLSHGLGIPAVDSLILAGLIDNNPETIYTTDSHMQKYRKKGVQVIKL